MGRTKGIDIWVTCKKCKKVFRTIPSAKRNYCSRKCWRNDLTHHITMQGKHHTQEAKDAISRKNKGKKFPGRGKGKHFTQTHKDKISKGNRKPKSKLH